ncbi:acyl carrier protein, partial [Nocardia nova]|uniref:acyl carrier protein n=1 Tax=Nocardia nova TaxID=37330 RepID=UPI001C46314A
LDGLTELLGLNASETTAIATVMPLLGRWIETRTGAIPQKGSSPHELNDRVDTSRSMEARPSPTLREIVLEEICVNMGYDHIDELGVGKNLIDAGMTSMTAVRIKKGILDRTGIDFDANAIFENPTAERLVAVLTVEPSTADL